ncbi:MAG: GtrA family protein [Mucilaginibacter sp.]|uniref:GtrA family protein n=1 Tax=Mucilaginibacter sp. L3T2-6 TaxID=3062491 RepID=UPI00267736EF|nr:GtrA family protein [Mucilaginibacter sp. L3T2-6]MDO3640479.1 GtrA family protein [Mucilaginibacter sp. L3T2-6]MDV6213182.1 GtrA family protein [Mucilaginibacter sp. L3T2-6]
MRTIHNTLRHAILTVIDYFYAPFKRFLPLQTFRYAAAGGANTVFDITLFSFAYNFVFKKHNLDLGITTLSPHIASLAFAFCFSLPSGFYLNRYVVFQDAGLKRRTQASRYLLVVFICIIFNYLLMKLFVDYWGWYPTPSKVLTTALVIIFSYSSQTYYFFKTKEPKKS